MSPPDASKLMFKQLERKEMNKNRKKKRPSYVRNGLWQRANPRLHDGSCQTNSWIRIKRLKTIEKITQNEETSLGIHGLKLPGRGKCGDWKNLIRNSASFVKRRHPRAVKKKIKKKKLHARSDLTHFPLTTVAPALELNSNRYYTRTRTKEKKDAVAAEICTTKSHPAPTTQKSKVELRKEKENAFTKTETSDDSIA